MAKKNNLELTSVGNSALDTNYRNYDMIYSGGGSQSGSDSYGSSQVESYGQSGSTSDSYTSSHTEGGSSSHSEGGSSSHSEGGSSSSSRGGSTSSSIGGSSSSSTGGSNSRSRGGSNSSSIGGSNTSSIGGSNSSSVGGSNTSSYGGGSSQSSNYGGNAQTSYGKTAATGQVSGRTQQMFDQSTQGYQRSEAVENAYANLQNAMDSKPTFQSKYEDKLNEIYDRIMNREAFSYDFNKDAMYQQYRDMYQQQGKRAMQDTMGQLSAMNNGYGSSYAQSAGQQAYQGYLQELNNRIPELRQQALEEYEREGSRLNEQYGLTNDQYNREYGQYRDLTSDWQNDRSFNQGMYQDERNFDYGQYQNDRSFWQNEYWNERNAEQTNMNQSQGTNWSEGVQNSTNWQNAASTNWNDTNSQNWNNAASTNWNNTASENWNNTNSRNWQDTDATNWSNTNSENWQDTNSRNWNDTESRNWQDTESRNWSDTNSQTHTDTTGWNYNNSNTINENHQTGWNNQQNWKQDTSGNSSSSANNTVQFSNKNSMDVFDGRSRTAIVEDVSALARQVNTADKSGKSSAQKALTDYLKDLYKNGSTGTGGENVQYSVEDLTNIYNRAITKDVLSNGSRNGAQTLSVEEMARKLGIRLQ